MPLSWWPLTVSVLHRGKTPRAPGLVANFCCHQIRWKEDARDALLGLLSLVPPTYQHSAIIWKAIESKCFSLRFNSSFHQAWSIERHHDGLLTNLSYLRLDCSDTMVLLVRQTLSWCSFSYHTPLKCNFPAWMGANVSTAIICWNSVDQVAAKYYCCLLLQE